MIVHLHGLLQSKTPESIILDIQGVGYLVYIPLSTFYKLPEAGEMIKLHIHTHSREDGWQLFGFWTIEEKKIFELLLTVSKIGPRLAKNILSHISTSEFISALSTSDQNRISSIHGIGEKTAKRLILELKDKISKLEAELFTDTHQNQDVSVSTITNKSSREDAVLALISLGYNRLLAERIINRILNQQSGNEGHVPSVEELIKQALCQLA